MILHSTKRLGPHFPKIAGGLILLCLAGCSTSGQNTQGPELPARSPASPAVTPATSSDSWKPAEERLRWALEHGPGNVQGMLLTNYLFDVLENAQELTLAPPTDWDSLMADQVLLFAPVNSDGTAMHYEPLPAADAKPAEGTVGIWLGGWTGETRINISASDIRPDSQSFSFKLEAPSQTNPEFSSSRDKRRQLAYTGTAHAIIQQYVALTGKMPTSYSEVLKLLALSHDLDPAWSGPMKTIEVAVNQTIPAVRFTYIKPDGSRQDSYEVYVIDSKAGTVTSETLFPPDAVNHPASHAEYEPLYTAKFPLLDPQPNDGKDATTTPESATSAQ